MTCSFKSLGYAQLSRARDRIPFSENCRMDRGKMDNTLLWGYHPVYEALRAGRRRVESLFMVREKITAREEALMRCAREAGVAVEGRTAQQVTAMVGHRRHQGICAKVSAYPLASLEDILAAGRAAAFILVLDQIVDPQNLGAIVRTAQCLGIHGVVMPKDRSAPPTAAASKASAGALEHMQVAYVTNLVDALGRLKKHGLWIAGAERHGRQPVFDADLTGPLAMVIGGEEKGIRPLVRKQCDFTIVVPQVGPLGSLNASAAAAVIMYEAFRQRTSSAPKG
jgi:23S rRNA (guanosine2251-2'-O)-methyltransferase